MRKAEIRVQDLTAGWLTQDGNSGHFVYDLAYLQLPVPVSLTLPFQRETLTNRVLFHFFDGLIPEGWLLDIAQKN